MTATCSEQAAVSRKITGSRFRRITGSRAAQRETLSRETLLWETFPRRQHRKRFPRDGLWGNLSRENVPSGNVSSEDIIKSGSSGSYATPYSRRSRMQMREYVCIIRAVIAWPGRCTQASLYSQSWNCWPCCCWQTIARRSRIGCVRLLRNEQRVFFANKILFRDGALEDADRPVSDGGILRLLQSLVSLLYRVFVRRASHDEVGHHRDPLAGHVRPRVKMGSSLSDRISDDFKYNTESLPE